MKYFLIILIFLFAGCSKDPKSPQPDCDGLKQGLLNNNVSLIVNALGNDLVMDYSQENLNALADTLTGGCDVKASLFCYNCIQTLPPQSEMYFALVNNAGDSTERVLDVTYTTDNKIKLVGVHE
jgi:hypothetical protein